MQTLQLDANNNLIVYRGGLSVIADIDACAQDSRTRLGLCKGENPYDTTEGIDYFNEILGKLGGEKYIREKIRNRILDNAECTEVDNLQISNESGEMSITADVATIYGEIQL